MFKIIGTTILLTKGDSAYIELIPLNPDGSRYETISGDIVRCQVRDKKSGTLITEVSSARDSNGQYLWSIQPEDTTNAEPGDYVWDAQLQSGGDVFTFIPESTFRLLSEVTV